MPYFGIDSRKIRAAAKYIGVHLATALIVGEIYYAKVSIFARIF